MPAPSATTLDAAEHLRMLRTKLRYTLPTRRAFLAIALALVLLDVAFGWFRAPWWMVGAPGLAAFAWHLGVTAVLRGRCAAWVVHAVFAADTLVLCTYAGLLGPTGVIMIAGIVLVVGGQALGTPEVARRQLALAVPSYTIARWVGLRAYDFDAHPGRIAIEAACLAALGAMATAGPAVMTFRLRRARAALAALERGDFAVRLSTRSEDDLGFLAASFNSTAEALGGTVRALHESEARLLAAREEAQVMATRMATVADVAGRVIGADSLAALYDVLRDACWQVFDFDGFAVAVFGAAAGPTGALGESDPLLAGDGPAARALAARVRTERASIVDAAGPDASTLVSPIFGADAVLGYVALRVGRAGAYRRGDVEVLEALAALAATAIRNVTLVDALRDSREAYAHQARHDPLTGLANRARLHERLALALAGPTPERVSVLVLDLDGFKRVNDSLGHAAGDALLVQVAERLLSATRGSDIVARLGGDEFAVLLENTRAPADAALVAERVLQALRAPFVLGGAEAVVGTSVGIARAATDGAAEGTGGDAARVGALLRDADLAMYRAKGAGKGRYAFFEPVMHAEAVGRLALGAEAIAELLGAPAAAGA